MSNRSWTATAAAALVGIAVMAGQAAPVSAQAVKAETGGGCSSVVMVLTAKYAKAAGVDFQVNDGKTLTKSMLQAGQGRIDVTSAVPAPYRFMTEGAAMYASLGKEKSSEIAKNLRGVFGFICGVYMPMVWDDSPIKSWEDLKGKRVFTGPPSGAAAVDVELFIEAMTGFKPNEDYTAVRLNWGGAQPAMRDGQLDAYFRPMQIPSAMVEELVAIRPVRLLPVSEADFEKPAMESLINKPGNRLVELPANTYDNLVNNDRDMMLPGYGLMQVAGEHVPDETIYNIVEAFFSNIDEIHRNNPALRGLSLEDPFTVLNVPLHPGAYKYFEEQGVEVPDNLMPPGMS